MPKHIALIFLSVGGADRITFLAPASICLKALSKVFVEQVKIYFLEIVNIAGLIL